MMTNWSYEEATDKGLLILQGEMTIQHVGDLKKALADAFRNAKQVTVDVSSTTAVDVAGVQLLCAGHRFSTSCGKKMQLRFGDNKRFADFLDKVGFHLNFICVDDEKD
ncbi:MAG: STAS domain-containing protein [Desulfuromonadales bacterium]|jgi:anti-anti-sigma regulatory factor